MHPSITVAQLGAILIMTALRSCAHIQRESRNDIKKPDEVEGYELDWLAKDLKRCEASEIMAGLDIPSADNPFWDDEVHSSSPAMAVMKIRARLAILSSDWKLENRMKVEVLQNAIEETMDEIFAKMALDDGFREIGELKWIYR